MRIENRQRSSMIRTNSRFRGPTELGKYSNFILEAVHDIKELCSRYGGNDYSPAEKGHEGMIHQNLVGYTGGEGILTANVATSTTLFGPIKPVFESINLAGATWSAYKGCSKVSIENGVRLRTSGIENRAGISTSLAVEEGQIIYIRFKVKFISGDAKAIAVGSETINLGKGDMKKFEIPENGSTIYIDKRLHCLQREHISLNLNVQHDPDTLKATTIEVSDMEIQYISEQPMNVQAVNTVVKPSVNHVESKIRNIIHTI